MTKLEQLIEELCPNGVEFKKIKDVFQRLKGTPITAGKMKEIKIQTVKSKFLQAVKPSSMQTRRIYPMQILQEFLLYWCNHVV